MIKARLSRGALKNRSGWINFSNVVVAAFEAEKNKKKTKKQKNRKVKKKRKSLFSSSRSAE
jgi:hypothetical protein